MGIIPQEIIDLINNTYDIAHKTLVIEKKQLAVMKQIFRNQEEIIAVLRDISHQDYE